MKKRVLIFPSGTEIANEIIASLQHNKAFELVFASSEMDSFCSFRSQNTFFLPFVTSQFFLNEVNQLVSDQKVDFIVPAHDDVAFGLSQMELDINAKIIGQSFKVNNILRFKDKTYEFFKNLLPLGAIYSTEHPLNDFPVFVKPKKGQGSLNAFSIKDEIEYQHFIESFQADDFVIMEEFPGEEYTIDCFSDQGGLLYAGARTRDKAIQGISVSSRFVDDNELNEKFIKYAEIISKALNLHGLWFYQMKKTSKGILKLLEVAPRVSGTMMLNRARGINFVELALYQAQGYRVEVISNSVQVSVGRSLEPVYNHNYQFDNLYVDFDDTLFLDESYINIGLMKLIFQCKNKSIPIHLITKNKKNNLSKVLHAYGITNIFDSIIHLTNEDCKVDYMESSGILIDDSFVERKQAIKAGIYALGIDAVNTLIEI